MNSQDSATAIQYLSERVTQEDFARMTPDKMYAFYSVPDSGKTTLIQNVLQPFLIENGQTALYLSHREIINLQNGEAFDKSVIHAKTYQKIEHEIVHKRTFFQEYDFIVCDEAHYFVEDSTMNSYTDESFNFVNNSKAIVILMTGTPDALKCIQHLWRRDIIVLDDIDIRHHNIQRICLVSATKKEEQWMREELHNLVQQHHRIVVYDSNISRLHKLSVYYQGISNDLGLKVSFICSRKNKQYSEYIDEEEEKRLIDTRHIDSDLLFVTSALNTGISIDEDFEYLFIFGNPSKTDIYQLIARIRRGRNGRRLITVYCSVPKISSVTYRMNALTQDLSYQDDPVGWQRTKKSKGVPDYVQIKHQYVVDSAGKRIFDHNGAPKMLLETTINQMRLGKIQQDIKEYRAILQYRDNKKAYHDLFVSRYAGIIVVIFAEEKEKELANELAILLGDYADLPYINCDNQKTIRTLCGSNGLQTSIGKINAFLDKYGCGLRLKSKAKKEGGEKFQAWFVDQGTNF